MCVPGSYRDITVAAGSGVGRQGKWDCSLCLLGWGVCPSQSWMGSAALALWRKEFPWCYHRKLAASVNSRACLEKHKKLIAGHVSLGSFSFLEQFFNVSSGLKAERCIM